MFLKIAIGIVVVLVLFLGYVATRPNKFYYERSGVINASAEKIFPYLHQFQLGSQWSPFEKMDPTMAKKYFGAEGEVGSGMDFEGKGNSGSGKLELLKVVPNESVEIRLTMTKPFHGENLVTYRLSPEGAGTKFTWSMSGENGFMGKLIAVIIDCDKMIGGQFTDGINNLKAVIESQK